MDKGQRPKDARISLFEESPVFQMACRQLEGVAEVIEIDEGVLERMLLIAPKEPLLWLEAGGHYARLGNLRAGIEAAERCRGLAVDERLRQRGETLLQDLKGRLN